MQNNSSLIFAEQVNKAIFLLGGEEGLETDKEAIQLLINNGIKEKDAIEIVLFLPIAFVRKLLPTANWGDTYGELEDDGIIIIKKYADSATYQIMWRLAIEYFKDSPNGNVVLNIAGRSAAFNVINQILLKNPNSKVEDILLSHTIIIR